MKKLRNTIEVGAAAPFTFLHMSDTHFTLVDERDNERKHALHEKRLTIFPNAEANAEFAVAYANEKGYMIAHTGDLIDFVSHANIDAAKAFCDSVDCFMSAGNHEFSQYVGEAFEDAEYRNQSLPAVQKSFKNDIRFAVREVNGVNLVALDNSYYLVEQAQLDALKAVAEQGKPIILFMHTPLYYEPHVLKRLEQGKVVASRMSVPEKYMKNYPEMRYKQQKEDETTALAYEYICCEPLIKTLITGHLHFDTEELLECGKLQIITGCNTLREITVV